MIINFIKIYLCFCTLFQLIYSDDDLNPKDPNVCHNSELVVVTNTVIEKIPVIKSQYVLCLKIPFLCKKNYTEYINGPVTKNFSLVRNKLECCKGYYKLINKCEPICVNQCLHGKCVKPDVCECEVGYGGAYCQNKCSVDNLIDDPDCDKSDLKCDCTSDKQEPGCEEVCKCKFQNCLNGYTLQNSEKLDFKCKCNFSSSESCSPKNGTCNCKAGFYGQYCEKPCPSNKFGKNCEQTCICEENYKCDPVIGCQCKFDLDFNKECLDHYLSSRYKVETAAHSNKSDTLAMLLIFIVACAFIIGAIIIKYQNKVKKLKLDLQMAYITYTANSSKDQFDNPVYACSKPVSNVVTIENDSFSRFSTLKATNKLTAANPIVSHGYVNNMLDCKDLNLFNKNFLADDINPKIKFNEDDSFSSNIYSTIDELKQKSPEKDLFYEQLNGNHTPNFDSKNTDDCDSLDIIISPPFLQLPLSNENNLFHYDQPKSATRVNSIDQSHYDTLANAKSLLVKQVDIENNEEQKKG